MADEFATQGAAADRLRLGFVTGTTPDRWARAWRQRRPERLTLVPVSEEEQVDVVRRGDVDLALVRLAFGTEELRGAEELHGVRLYDERQVVVAGREHLVSAAETVTLDDLADEQLVRPHASGWRPAAEQLDWSPMSERQAIETVAAGTGVVIVPMSVARLYHRKDVVQREITDLPPTTIALVWLRAHDDDRTQAFVGVVKGRTANTSRH
jgi:DNA-binding transcriptional LysR family regulator